MKCQAASPFQSQISAVNENASDVLNFAAPFATIFPSLSAPFLLLQRHVICSMCHELEYQPNCGSARRTNATATERVQQESSFQWHNATWCGAYASHAP